MNQHASLLAATSHAAEVFGLKQSLEWVEEELGRVKEQLKESEGMINKTMVSLMTPNPKTINENVMIVQAEEQMLRDKITLLVVVDDANNLSGILEIYDR